MPRPVVLIADELSPATVAALGPDFDVRYCDGTDRLQLLADIGEADAVLVRSATRIDEEAISAAPRLKIIARAGVGLDNVDVDAATQGGVMVVNAPTSNIVSAAELTVALLLASARNISPAHQALRRGEWQRSAYAGVELAEKVVGIVGLGRIGLLVAQRLGAFGVTLIAYDPFVQPSRAAQFGVRLVDLDELLRRSDFITVHLPKTKDTIGLIGDDALARVKSTVHIVNAARGGIIDEAALYRALTEGRVAGAGIDVYATEPCADSPLFELDTVVATPHLGASTAEAQEKAGVAVAHSVRLALAGELVPDAVNVQGGAIAEEVRPYVEPTERLGRIASALAPAPVARVDIDVLGEIATADVSVLQLAALKGVFAVLSEGPVSYVNAPVIASDRGIETSISVEPDCSEHRSLVRVRLALTDGRSVSVAGTVVGPRDVEKLMEVDGFDIDVPVSEHMAFYTYEDRPGMVGVVGQILGDADVNIAGMQVSRTKAGGMAMIVLTVDSAIPTEALACIAAEIGAGAVHAVDLDEAPGPMS